MCEIDVVKLSPKDTIVNRPYMIPMKVAHNFMTRKNESPVRIGMDQSLGAHHSSVNNLKNGGQITGRDSDIGLRITN